MISIDGDDVSDDAVIYKYLTGLYRNVYGSEWYSDKRMRYVISCLTVGLVETKDHNMLYVDGYYKPDNMFDFFGGKKSYSSLSGIIIDGSKSFICVRGYDDVFGYYVIDYDFENNKVNSYDFYSYTSIYGIIN